MRQRSTVMYRQQGLSLVGFMFVIVILALLAVLGMKVIPSITEYAAIKRAIVAAKNAGNTAREIQDAFDKQRVTAYIDSVNGKDLEIVKTGEGFEVGVAYQKKIELFGPASLVIDYEASTGNTSGTKKYE